MAEFNFDIQDEDVIHEVSDGTAVMVINKVEDHPVAVITVLDHDNPNGAAGGSIILDRLGLLHLLERVTSVLVEVNDAADRT